MKAVVCSDAFERQMVDLQSVRPTVLVPYVCFL
jgi:hypothetical protein